MQAFSKPRAVKQLGEVNYLWIHVIQSLNSFTYPTVVNSILYLLAHLYGRAVLLGRKICLRRKAGRGAGITTNGQVIEYQRVHLATYNTTSRISIESVIDEAKSSEYKGDRVRRRLIIRVFCIAGLREIPIVTLLITFVEIG